VDRLEPTKNILRGLEAFDLLLDQHPDLRGKVRFVMMLVPSRESVRRYRDYARRVNRLVQRINAKYGTPDDPAVVHISGNDQARALAAMRCCDVLLVNYERNAAFEPQATSWQGGLKVFDISKPAQPREIAFLQMPGKGVHRMTYWEPPFAYMSGSDDGFIDQVHPHVLGSTRFRVRGSRPSVTTLVVVGRAASVTTVHRHPAHRPAAFALDKALEQVLLATRPTTRKARESRSCTRENSSGAMIGGVASLISTHSETGCLA